MTHINTTIKNEINSLVDLGSTIIEQASRASSSLKGNDLANVSSWTTRLGQLIRKLYGENSQHFANYNRSISLDSYYNIHSNWYGHISEVQGIALTVA